MKKKTSITLSEEILTRIDQNLAGKYNRSSFIEMAVRTYLELLDCNRRDQRDLEIIDRISDKLNSEAMDVLRYQTEI